jgi:hypothetical protein
MQTVFGRYYYDGLQVGPNRQIPWQAYSLHKKKVTILSIMDPSRDIHVCLGNFDKRGTQGKRII